MTREKNKCTHTLINPRKKKKHNTQTSKQNATERASSSVKNEVQKRREKTVEIESAKQYRQKRTKWLTKFRNTEEYLNLKQKKKS